VCPHEFGGNGSGQLGQIYTLTAQLRASHFPTARAIVMSIPMRRAARGPGEVLLAFASSLSQ